ncbi:MAG: hypothetical protein SPL05_06755 [Eubacteriales bacterium]|nr:hypothetical protein [Eubacteriales bacterium]
MKRFSIVLLIVLLTSTFVFADELKYNYITPGYYTANKMFAIDENFKTTNKNNFYSLQGTQTIQGVTFNIHIIVSN